jgi:glycosyltransferase involved in cell wall biosynthesis
MPVYNGEDFLHESLDALLAQTFTDFELIIVDNASHDRTEEICRAYAAQDTRIRYYRNEQNIGAARNFNHVFELARGEYFKWAAHDDLCAPTFLERCIEVLDSDPGVILCWSYGQIIDPQGNIMKTYEPKPMLNSAKTHERFHECVNVPHDQTAVFGVVRTEALRQTRLIGSYASSDRVLLGELAIRGRFYEVPEILFFYRRHPKQSWQAYRGRHAYMAWFDPSRAGKMTFPHWRLLLEHFISVSRACSNGYEQIRCNVLLLWWIRLHWRYLLNNLLLNDGPYKGLKRLQDLRLAR